MAALDPRQLLSLLFLKCIEIFGELLLEFGQLLLLTLKVRLECLQVFPLFFFQVLTFIIVDGDVRESGCTHYG